MKNASIIQNLLYGEFAILGATILGFVAQSEFDANVFPMLAILGVAFLVLGALLIRFGMQEQGKLKIWTILAGIFALCPFLFSILHNVFYALNELFPTSIDFFSLLDGLSLIIAMIIAPIGFLISAFTAFALLKVTK